MSNGFLNFQLISLAEHSVKTAFVDPATMTGGGQGGGDPAAAAGGGMPADPSMMGGGGAPPADPAAGGGGGGDALMGMIQQMQQQINTMSQGGGGGGMAGGAGAGGVEPIKPKIDVNVTLLQILKILARIADALGIQIPASEMVATSNDVTQFAQQQSQQGAAPQSAIQGISPIQGASPALAAAGGGGGEKKSGFAFDPARHFDDISDKASAQLAILAHRSKAA